MTEMEQIMKMVRDNIFSQFLNDEQQKMGMENALIFMMITS